MEQVYYLYDTKPPRLVSPKSKRGVMTKTLQQIQIENRKFILEAILAGNNLRLLKENIADFSGSKLTLSKVLLALPKINKENKTLDFLIGERGWEKIGNEWFDGYKKCFIARVETIFSCDCCEDFWTDVFVWNLELETLEEQSEETQRGINSYLIIYK